MMTKERKGEIAILHLKHQLRKDGIHLGPNFKREVHNLAKDLEISNEEAMEFAMDLITDVVDEAFKK